MKLSILILAVFFGGVALVAAPYAARAEDKKPAETKDAVKTMEKRASEAFNRGQYSLAKELFTKVLDRVKDDPKRADYIQEQVRVCDTNIKQLAASATVPAADQLNSVPAIETAIEKRVKHVAPKDGSPLVIAIKELGNFDYDADKGGNIPEDVKKLNGAKIRVQGFMIPLDQADNISHFSLVPSLFACCFGQPPQIQHQIVVSTPKGKAVGYYPDEIVCEGTLRVEEKKDDGYIVSVFEMDVQSVKPAAK
jgi:hypothetical protein